MTKVRESWKRKATGKTKSQLSKLESQEGRGIVFRVPLLLPQHQYRPVYMSIRFSPERYASGSLEKATLHPGPQK